MEIKEYENIYNNEATHFFYVGNHKIILSLVKKYLSKNSKNLKILDAGCGTGLLAKKLEKFGNVVGVDISKEALKFATIRKVHCKLASVTKLPFKEKSFDLVTSVDVIYHKQIKNDLVSLKEFKRVLKPGGILIIRVPANKWLKQNHDKYVHTRQRYSADELRNKLMKVGFGVEKLSFVNMSLLPLAVLGSFWEKVANNKPLSKISTLPRSINSILLKTFSWESKVLNFINLPFGLGLIAVCRKK